MFRSIQRALCLIALVALAGGCRPKPSATAKTPAAGPITVRDVGFATPESVLHDPIADVYLVSNINGSPLDADDNGFISVVSPEGKLLELKWIDGARDSVTLNAPKGMTLVGPWLYVADLNTIRRFNRRTGAPEGTFQIPGATFLNDIAATEDGSVYFTDTGLKAGAAGFDPSGTDAVYRLRPSGQLDTLARGDQLGHPNGIALAHDSVWVVGYGSGEIYRIDKGQKVDVVKPAKGGLDGLVIAFGEFFVSSWEGETIYRGPPMGPFSELLTHVKAPADIGHDLWRNRLLIPLFNDNEIRIIPLAL